jgi:membrane protein DedA with SNARE-associated domain
MPSARSERRHQSIPFWRRARRIFLLAAIACLIPAAIHISPKHLKWADDWFERYGSWTVFFSRMLPIVRTFISLPAGVAKMPFWRFTAYTLAGCVPWVLALALIGEKVGENWEDWRHKLGYLDYFVLAAIVIGVVYWLLKRRRGGSDPDEGGPGVPAEVSSSSGV